ncbi:hypothetical protein ABZP36_021193 [Zizania latifolia]
MTTARLIDQQGLNALCPPVDSMATPDTYLRRHLPGGRGGLILRRRGGGKWCGDDEEAGVQSNTEENAMDHRMPFDLANEALEILVQALRNPTVQKMQAVDSIVAREACKSAWIEVLHQDAYVLGRKVERAIFDELISDIVQELFI